MTWVALVGGRVSGSPAGRRGRAVAKPSLETAERSSASDAVDVVVAATGDTKCCLGDE
jgi:hypothetical protein